MSVPVTAPFSPPETGASRLSKPRARAVSASSRASAADTRRVIDEDGAGRDPGEGAFGPEQHRAQVVVVAAAA